MIYNIIVSLTNLPCLLPIYTALKANDFITSGIITFVSVGSIVSHLIENHKHGMEGLPNVSQEMSYYWNRIDVLGSILTIGRLSWLYYQKYQFKLPSNHFYILLLPLIFLRISEYDKYNVNLKLMYIVTHSLWHLSVFYSMYHYLNTWIY